MVPNMINERAIAMKRLEVINLAPLSGEFLLLVQFNGS